MVMWDKISAPDDQDPPSPALNELLNWLFVQPDLVGGVPAHDSGGWDQMIFKVQFLSTLW